MSDLTKYNGALKYAFSKTFGGEWTEGAVTKNAQGQAVHEFKNAAIGRVLHVTGAEEGDYAKINAIQTDMQGNRTGEANLSIPKSWIGL